MKLLNEVYNDLIIEVVGSWIWVSGNTRENSQKLKEMVLKWARKKKRWYFGKKIKLGRERNGYARYYSKIWNYKR